MITGRFIYVSQSFVESNLSQFNDKGGDEINVHKGGGRLKMWVRERDTIKADFIFKIPLYISEDIKERERERWGWGQKEGRCYYKGYFYLLL